MNENTADELTREEDTYGPESEAQIASDWQDEAPGTANQPAPDDARDEDAWDADFVPDDENEANHSFKLKHLGQEFTVSREEVIALAQKGRDYDRIRARADTLAGEVQQLASGTHTPEQRRDREIAEFMGEYKGISPASIPGEVWGAVRQGTPLLAAYRSFENKSLKAQLGAAQQTAANREKAIGSRATDGVSGTRGEMEEDWYRD